MYGYDAPFKSFHLSYSNFEQYTHITQFSLDVTN
jgi:hypothetical protein